jgi:hypothetical protein
VRDSALIICSEILLRIVLTTHRIKEDWHRGKIDRQTEMHNKLLKIIDDLAEHDRGQMYTSAQNAVVGF